MKRLKKCKWLSRLKDWPEWKEQWAENLLAALLPIMFLIFIPMVSNSLHSSKIHIGKILFDAFAGGEIVMCAIAILISTKTPSDSNHLPDKDRRHLISLKSFAILLFSLTFAVCKYSVLLDSADYAPNFWVVIISAVSILASGRISYRLMEAEDSSTMEGNRFARNIEENDPRQNSKPSRNEVRGGE